ncbi:positive regulator of sigma(E), RseC/MucC [Halanaerobium congolense]|jgi:sigma-E factor negative regulatory protein RseC|uniref:Positive regulator of sigma(E), RseC/MucC n=1 Tax=Halanaerobium congolense TaxID=54121 RepID=A0A1G8LXC4_9FIRM|nr:MULTISPECIES: SoxR reducing system RseC family protein [Halanaerobium]KXS48275.1 MAG: sigma-E factor negative regulatory protein RseC [Halanaerobium sp. T82-1]PUU88521.1 MAG: sigma-E factor negative regulatory protein RseC [Halanaerobium sp.]PUU92657.1 MAG: sigma-E factor negative regulatory protein RseC [Halanaerobium sp.]RCW78017.1 RseC/MucC-like positive regulator of sigma(E) [Halanaerobium sp. DL-01]SDI60364.1 positive regulator of sigma(E), RseC/MucC [Halanaerobium congolense]
MEELATVIKRKKNKAEVKITRYSACSKCDKSCSLAGDSHDQDEIVLEVEDKIGVKNGDQVLIEMRKGNLLFASVVVYVIPIFLMIAGYFFGVWAASLLNIAAVELAGIAGTFIFLILSFLINKLFNSYFEKISSFQPKIKKVIN